MTDEETLGGSSGKLTKLTRKRYRIGEFLRSWPSYKVISGGTEGVASALEPRYVTCDPRGVTHTHTHTHSRTHESLPTRIHSIYVRVHCTAEGCAQGMKRAVEYIRAGVGKEEEIGGKGDGGEGGERSNRREHWRRKRARERLA